MAVYSEHRAIYKLVAGNEWLGSIEWPSKGRTTNAQSVVSEAKGAVKIVYMVTQNRVCMCASRMS